MNITLDKRITIKVLDEIAQERVENLVRIYFDHYTSKVNYEKMGGEEPIKEAEARKKELQIWIDEEEKKKENADKEKLGIWEVELRGVIAKLLELNTIKATYAVAEENLKNGKKNTEGLVAVVNELKKNPMVIYEVDNNSGEVS